MMYSGLILCTVLLYCVSGTDHVNDDCVSHEELAAVKTNMEKKIDDLHSQLDYWQNVTINIIKEHILPTNTDPTTACNDVETVDSSVFDNITLSNKVINEKLENLKDTMTIQLESIKEQQITDRKCCDDTLGTFHNPAQNCSQIAQNHPTSTSGDYWLKMSPGYAVKVYCDMERVCECDQTGSGAWMRVADIDMTRNTENCPSGFRKITSSGKIMCGCQSSSCISTYFSSYGIPYSRVCGKIIGYQFGRVNAFSNYGTAIEENFLDGIVLTYESPRRHIWSFGAGITQTRTDRNSCPCNAAGIVPAYVGNDYFCDSGYEYSGDPPFTYFLNDPLWDGSGCVSGDCCGFNTPPWFCKGLPEYTTEDIELRLCLDEALSNEDVLFEAVELYVQ